jgi:hypothetical protein
MITTENAKAAIFEALTFPQDSVQIAMVNSVIDKIYKQHEDEKKSLLQKHSQVGECPLIQANDGIIPGKEDGIAKIKAKLEKKHG